MKAVAIVLVLLGFIAGCAQQQAPSPSAAPADRPDLRHASPSECEKAGRTWNHTAGVCM
jgi:PBP1b-binding outer membrane lipoprotein LpoB